MKVILYPIFLFLAMMSAEARTMQGKVTRVIDGNTLEFLSSDGESYTILLSGIDCPELKQAYGDEARICLQKLTLNKKASVTINGKDRSGTSLAEVLIDGKTDPRIQLLKEGLAWTTEKNADSTLETHRAASQSKKKGLWKDENPTPPWTYRHQQSMLEAKSS